MYLFYFMIGLDQEGNRGEVNSDPVENLGIVNV